MVQILHGTYLYEKKIFIVELRFKLSWPSCIFICSIWPPWMGIPSTPNREGKEVTSGKESVPVAWCLVSGTPGETRLLKYQRPASQDPGKRPWALLGALAPWRRIGRAQQLQRKPGKQPGNQFRLLRAAANTSTSRQGPDHTTGHLLWALRRSP